MTIVTNSREKIVALLESAKREGMSSMIGWLIVNGFFVSPASTRFHGCYEGGLAQHSLNLYEQLALFNEHYKLECPKDSTIIASLLHDVCKVGAYKLSKSNGPQKYAWNKAQPRGHALLSLVRISEHIELTDLETAMIKFHMGVYHLNEFDPASGKGEYPLRSDKSVPPEQREQSLANAWYHHPIVKVMYFCDELVTLAEKAEEGIK